MALGGPAPPAGLGRGPEAFSSGAPEGAPRFTAHRETGSMATPPTRRTGRGSAARISGRAARSARAHPIPGHQRRRGEPRRGRARGRRRRLAAPKARRLGVFGPSATSTGATRMRRRRRGAPPPSPRACDPHRGAALAGAPDRGAGTRAPDVAALHLGVPFPGVGVLARREPPCPDQARARAGGQRDRHRVTVARLAGGGEALGACRVALLDGGGGSARGRRVGAPRAGAAPPDLLAAQLVRASGGSPARCSTTKGIRQRLPHLPAFADPALRAGYASFRANDERIVVSAWMFSIR
jgi:hypothetical protein